jgi:hypothetical protein
MNKDNHLMFEAYTSKFFRSKPFNSEDAENFREQMPDSRENAEHTYGVDPKDAAEYDQAKAEISYNKYSFWDAYHAVKEGAWTEDDFHQWASSVWSAGAEESKHH